MSVHHKKDLWLSLRALRQSESLSSLASAIDSPMPAKELRRQQILDRARDVFAEKGYHGAKVDDIVAAASVARGTFYLYFHDKRSVFEELVRSALLRIGQAVQRIDPTKNVEVQIRANIEGVLELFLNDPKMAKILLTDVAGSNAELDRLMSVFTGDLGDLVERALHDGQELGLVQAGERRVVSHFLLGGMKEVLLQLVRAKVPVDRQAVIRDLYALLARGVLIPQPEKKVSTESKPKSKTRGRA